MSGILFGRTVFIPSVISIFTAAAAFAAPSYNYPSHFLGVAYSPTHYAASDNSNPQTTLDAFAKDFPLVSRKGFKVARSYWLSSRAHYLNFVGEAYRNNLKVIIEVPVNPAAGNNQQIIDQFNAFLAYVKATPESKKGQVMGSVSFDNYTYRNVDYVTPSMFASAVILVLAGNENIPADPHDSASLSSLKNNIQDKLNNNGFGTIAVSYCLEADVWAGDPSQYPNRRALLESLADGVPFLMTCYPFEWGMPIDQSVEGGAHALQAYVNQVTGHYPDLVGKHPIMFGETGWASEGTANGSSPANLANEAAYLSKVYTWIGKKTNPVCGILAFEAFDESTKTGPEYQKHYGLWTGGTPSRNGDWKAGLPPPPSVNFCAVSGSQVHRPPSAAGESRGTPRDRVRVRGFWPPEGATDLTRTGLEVSLDGNAISLAAADFTFDRNGYRYDADGVRFRLTPEGLWYLYAPADLENIDSRDGLDVSLSCGEMSLPARLHPNEESQCLFRYGTHTSEALEAGGTPFPRFGVVQAALTYAHRRDMAVGDIRVYVELPDGAFFDPRVDVVSLAADDYEREIPAGSFVPTRDGAYAYEDRSEGGVSVVLDFVRHRGRIRFARRAAWGLFSPHDGIDFFLTIGPWRGGVRFDPSHAFSFEYQASKKR